MFTGGFEFSQEAGGSAGGNAGGPGALGVECVEQIAEAFAGGVDFAERGHGSAFAPGAAGAEERDESEQRGDAYGESEVEGKGASGTLGVHGARNIGSRLSQCRAGTQM